MTTTKLTTKVEWHDCKTDPPEYMTTVLVWDGVDVVTGHCNEGEWETDQSVDEPKLWAEIPHPKVDDEAPNEITLEGVTSARKAALEQFKIIIEIDRRRGRISNEQYDLAMAMVRLALEEK